MNFETKITRRQAILLNGAWSPQFLRVKDVAHSIPFTRIMTSPLILLTESVIGTLQEWMPLFEKLAKDQFATTLVVTGMINDALLQCMVVNDLRDTMNICVVGGDMSSMSIAFGKPFHEVPQEISQLPKAKEAWIRKNAAVIFPQSPDSCQSVMEDITIIEVGGEDYEDQQNRLRFLAGAIRDIKVD